jgi:hypothetical protein
MQKYFIYLVGRLKRWCERQLWSENEKQFVATMRKLMAAVSVSKKKAQDECNHVAGGNVLSDSSDYLGRTSIVWHTLNTGEEFGLCLNCQREFRNTDSDFKDWRARTAMCRPSSAIGFAGAKNGSLVLTFSDDEKFDVNLDATVPVEVSFSDPKAFDEKWGW